GLGHRPQVGPAQSAPQLGAGRVCAAGAGPLLLRLYRGGPGPAGTAPAYLPLHDPRPRSDVGSPLPEHVVRAVQGNPCPVTGAGGHAGSSRSVVGPSWPNFDGHVSRARAGTRVRGRPPGPRGERTTPVHRAAVPVSRACSRPSSWSS